MTPALRVKRVVIVLRSLLLCLAGQQDSPDKAASPTPLPEHAPPLPPIDDDDAPIIWKRNGAPQKPGAPPDPEDFMTWEPEEWVDFSLIKWPAAGEHLGTLKSFFALAIIFFYKPEVQQQHAALWQRLQDKWVESFLGPINDAALQHPPKTGACQPLPSSAAASKPEHRHKVSGVPILKKLQHSKKRRREVENLWSTIPGVTLLRNVHYCNYSNNFNKTHYIRIMVIISTIAIISIILLLLYFTSSCWQET